MKAIKPKIINNIKLYKMKRLITMALGVIFAKDDSDWANPIDRTDYPNMDIGHY